MLPRIFHSNQIERRGLCPDVQSQIATQESSRQSPSVKIVDSFLFTICSILYASVTFSNDEIDVNCLFGK